MTYSFHDKEDPTEEQLQQLMHDACEDAKKKWDNAKGVYFRQLREAAKIARDKYQEQHGIS